MPEQRSPEEVGLNLAAFLNIEFSGGLDAETVLVGRNFIIGNRLRIDPAADSSGTNGFYTEGEHNGDRGSAGAYGDCNAYRTNRAPAAQRYAFAPHRTVSHPDSHSGLSL